MARGSIDAPKAQSRPALYRKLRPRPNGPSREEVAANQRSRLHGATIEAIAARGYVDTSVAQLCRLAGVSKRTFYEQFDNKDACFLATYEMVVACATGRIEAARDATSGSPEARLRGGLHGLVRAAVERPKAARLALMEVLFAGPAALARRDRIMQDLERAIAVSLGGDSGLALDETIATGIVCGFERAFRHCARTGQIESLPALAQELVEWALAYRSPSLSRLAGATAGDEDRSSWGFATGRTRQGSSRARLVRAAGEIAAGEGHQGLTPGKVARRAGLAEAEFWDSYESIEDCFTDALELACLEAMLSSARAARSIEDPLLGVHRGLAALMERIAGDPVLRAVAFGEVFSAGPRAVERSEQLLDRLLELLLKEIPAVVPRSDAAAAASGGAVWGVIAHHVLRGGADRLPGLAGYATYLVLTPVLGSEAAARVASDSSAPVAAIAP